MTITTPTQRSQSYSSPDTAAGPVALKPMPKTSTQPAAGKMGIPGVRAPGTPMSKDALDVWEFALFPKLSNALGQGFKNGVNPDREALARDLSRQGTGAEPFPAERKDAAQNWTPAERRELTVRVTDALVKWERQKADLTTKHQTGDLPDRNTVLRTAFKTAYDDISERRTGGSATRAKPDVNAPRIETPEDASRRVAEDMQKGRDIAKKIIERHLADPLGGAGVNKKLEDAAKSAEAKGKTAVAMGIRESIPPAAPKRNAPMPDRSPPSSVQVWSEIDLPSDQTPEEYFAVKTVGEIAEEFQKRNNLRAGDTLVEHDGYSHKFQTGNERTEEAQNFTDFVDYVLDAFDMELSPEKIRRGLYTRDNPEEKIFWFDYIMSEIKSDAALNNISPAEFIDRLANEDRSLKVRRPTHVPIGAKPR